MWRRPLPRTLLGVMDVKFLVCFCRFGKFKTSGFLEMYLYVFVLMFVPGTSDIRYAPEYWIFFFCNFGCHFEIIV